MAAKPRRAPSLDIVEVFDPDPARLTRAVRRLLAIDLAAPPDRLATLAEATPPPSPRGSRVAEAPRPTAND